MTRHSRARRGVRTEGTIATLALLAACGDGDPVRGGNDETAGGTAGSAITDSPGGSDDAAGDESDSTGAPSPLEPSPPFSLPTCFDAPEPTSALRLLGNGEGVHVGPAPALGLATFTLEAWVRWDGFGTTANSGTGGVVAEPIVTKGRGEDDGTNIDCNYFLGVDAAGRLVADFEDIESGGNHPIASTNVIAVGEWTHVAATYDGAAWRLYIGGQLEADLAVQATPRHDSIQHFGIGQAFDSLGVAQGGFDGTIDAVRVWNRALGEAELQMGVFESPRGADGLVAHWPLDDAAGMDVPELVAGLSGTRTGGAWDDGPPPLSSTRPAEPSPVAPAELVAAGDVELQAEVFDLDGDEMRVEFWGRPLPDLEPFSIVALPDTQYYVAEENGGNNEMFLAQTQWVVENAETHDIRAVLHVGDLVEHRENFVSEWLMAESAIETLEQSLPGWPEGVPYGIAVGNHDQNNVDMPGAAIFYNQYFGVDRFEGKSWYGGHYGPGNENSFITFSAGGLDFLALMFEYDQPDEPPGNGGPNAEVLQWARGVLRDHPDHLGILVSHSCLQNSEVNGTVNTPFSVQGQTRYDALRGEPNLRLAVCGHVRTEGRRTDVAASTVHTLLADYQFDGQGGSGKLRLYTFHPAENRLQVRTYSPYLDQWYEGPDAQFDLPIDLDSGGGELELLETVEHAKGGEVSATWHGLPAGMRYEWQVKVTDCTHTVTGPTRVFTTQ
jgi:hypothetical protein